MELICSTREHSADALTSNQSVTMKAKVLLPISCRRLVVVAASTVGVAILPILPAQVTATSPANAPKSADVIELSPFTVNETSDRGYAAQETLAGTRMRTNLADVGAALTVVTPLFLQDLAVNSFDQALIFTPSVDTFQGSNNTNGSELRYSDNQNYTIRGFIGSNGNQAISHDFFTALDTNDAYNNLGDSWPPWRPAPWSKTAVRRR